MRFTKSDKGIRYLLIALVMIGVTISVIGATLNSLRKEAVQTHRHIANLHAYTFDEHFSSILQQVSHTMDRIPTLVDTIHQEESLSRILNELLQNAHYLRSLSLSDEQGFIVASSYQPNVGEKIDFSHFLPIPFGETSVLRMGVPWEGRDFSEGRLCTNDAPLSPNANHFIPVLKKVFHAHKAYHIVANLNSDYFANRYSNILPQEQGTVSLWRLDGVLLFSNNPYVNVGASHYSIAHPKMREDENFYDHLIANRHNPMDTFRLARLMPFIVEIAMDETNALGFWDKERSKVLWISIVLISHSGFLGLALIIRYYEENERQKKQLAYEKQFRIAMEATQTGVFTWNFQSNDITWDPQCYLLLGYQPNAFKPSIEIIHTLTHPDEATSIFTSIREQILRNGHFMIERRMKTLGEEWVWIQARGKVIEYTDTNEPLFVTGVYINIDAQKKAERLHLLAVAFETQEAILITDASEHIVKVNEAFTRITGYEEKEIMGKTPRVLKSGKHDAVFYETLWNALLEKGFWQGELWNKRKNGEIYAEHLTITTIRDSSGQTTHYLANFNDITARKIAQQQIHELAYHDALTRLSNRTMLDENLQNIIDRHVNTNYFGALIFIDLDHFKTLNDTFGHDAGDMLLIQTANRLQDTTREKDMVVRLGGDEFIVIIEHLGTNKSYAIFQAQTVAKKILSRLCEPYALAHGNYTIGASIGFSLFGEMHKEAQVLLKEADTAMYQAKENGRNQIAFFEEMTEK